MDREVLISNEITIYNPSGTVRRWCKENLMFFNPDYEKKERMGFWTGDTPMYISLFKNDEKNIIVPIGCAKNIFPMLSEYEKRVDLADNGRHEEFKSSDLFNNLYDYQKEAVSAMLKAGYGILQSPCGSGKTQMGIAMASMIGRKTLWVTHTQDLLNQSYERAKQYFPKEMLGKITGGKVQIGSFITFATVQTLSKVDLPMYKYEWDVVIVDECHRVCGTPTQVGMFSKVISNLAARNKYGLSATVHRADGLIGCTFALIGEVKHVVPKEAVEDKTMQVTVKKVDLDFSVGREAFNTDGTLNYTRMISSLAENKARSQAIINHLVDAQDKDIHSNLILSARTEHLKEMMELMPEELKPYCCYIDGKMTSKKARAERVQAIEDMRTGKKRFLFASYNLAKEGLDIPRLDKLFLATPQKDYAVVIQSIGRVGRVFCGKTSAVAYDYVDAFPYCESAYKQRKRHYKKEGCLIVEL